MIDTGRLYADLRARGFSAHVAIRSITYVLDVLAGVGSLQVAPGKPLERP